MLLAMMLVWSCFVVFYPCCCWLSDASNRPLVGYCWELLFMICFLEIFFGGLWLQGWCWLVVLCSTDVVFCVWLVLVGCVFAPCFLGVLWTYEDSPLLCCLGGLVLFGALFQWIFSSWFFMPAFLISSISMCFVSSLIYTIWIFIKKRMDNNRG